MPATAPMDPEKTAPFQLGEGSEACLMLHGFTGTPWDLLPLGEALARQRFFVSAIQLPGHCTTPEAMATVNSNDWKMAAEQALLRLNGFRQIFVVGLSMGALLALILAAAHPGRVSGLALLAPAMRLRGWAAELARWASPLVVRLLPYIRKTATDIDDPLQREAAPILPGFASACLRDLWRLQDEAKRTAKNVRAPVLIAMAEHDHVVAFGAAVKLARSLTQAQRVRWVQLPVGFHIIPRDRGAETAAREVISFFDGVRHQTEAREAGAGNGEAQLRAGD